MTLAVSEVKRRMDSPILVDDNRAGGTGAMLKKEGIDLKRK
jgi:hypothetical protein